MNKKYIYPCTAFILVLYNRVGATEMKLSWTKTLIVVFRSHRGSSLIPCVSKPFPFWILNHRQEVVVPFLSFLFSQCFTIQYKLFAYKLQCVRGAPWSLVLQSTAE